MQGYRVCILTSGWMTVVFGAGSLSSWVVPAFFSEALQPPVILSLAGSGVRTGMGALGAGNQTAFVT